MSYQKIKNYLNSTDYYGLTTIQKQMKERSIEGETFYFIGTISDVTEDEIIMYDYVTSKGAKQILFHIEYSNYIYSVTGSNTEPLFGKTKMRNIVVTTREIQELKPNQKVAVVINAKYFSY